MPSCFPNLTITDGGFFSAFSSAPELLTSLLLSPPPLVVPLLFIPPGFEQSFSVVEFFVAAKVNAEGDDNG